ncbi:MAG: hypothetical protein PWP48_993 [Clostridiales bacterium]|jgi:hypothetical protein|nr:hypothetical protein [Clostridiales bacterium]
MKKGIKPIKIAIFVITICMILNISPSVLASEPETNAKNTVNFTIGTYDGTESTGDISYGQILNIGKVKEEAKSYLDVYITTSEPSLNKDQLKLDADFVNLYDVQGNLFAYMIPITDITNKEIGYITMGALENSYGMYEIAFNDDVKYIKEFTDRKNGKVIFIPPMNYVIESNDGKYYEFKPGNDVIEITKDFKKSRKKIKEIYYKTVETRKESKKSIGITNSTNVQTTVLSVIDSAKLLHSSISNFVPVYDGSTTFYGGDQAWWGKDSTKAGRGCGPVAAANITCYFARKNSTTWRALYAPSNMSKTSFLSHMNTLYSYLSPGVLGTWWEGFTKGVEKFSSDRKAPLVRVTNNWAFTLDNTSLYIKNGLKADSPVAMLNMQPFGDYEYKAHWMTITEYSKHSDGTRWVTVSTWGKKKVISYDDWFNSTHLWGGGLIYFH